MKVVAAILILSLVAISSQEQTFDEVVAKWQAQIVPYKQFCLEETKADDNLVYRAIQYGEYPENNRALECSGLCFFKKLGVMNDVGEISEEGFLSRLQVEDKDIAQEVVQECKGVKSDDLCEKAYTFSKCIRRATKERMTENE